MQTPNQILAIVATAREIPVSDILGRGRTRWVAQSRQIVVAILRHHLRLTHADIARVLKFADHTNVTKTLTRVKDCQYLTDWADQITAQLSNPNPTKTEN